MHENGGTLLMLKKDGRCPWVNISKGKAGFLSNIKLVKGNGQKIRFWKDVRVGKRTPSESFPQSYGLSLGHN